MTANRRVVLGRQADNSFGLRVSLPGHDALTASQDDTTQLSFNSEWNLLRIHALGISSTSPIPFPALTYYPYFEARIINGNVVYADHSYEFTVLGNPAFRTPLRMQNTFSNLQILGKDIAGSVLYVVYREPSVV